MNNDRLNMTYPASRAAVGVDRWDRITGALRDTAAPEVLSRILRAGAPEGLPAFLDDLLKLEHALLLVKDRSAEIPSPVDVMTVNPTVRLEELRWQGLTALLAAENVRTADPTGGAEQVLLWFDPGSGRARCKPAANDDFLALKLTAEGVSPEEAAAGEGIPVGAIDAAIDRAVWQGLLLAPPSRLIRDPSVFAASCAEEEQFLAASSFTLQWHITQVCDLHCKHCYDRTDRSPLTLDEAVRVLDDLRVFCRSRNVQGAISFTGGNPLLHPRFDDIYRAAVERNFSTAILGNPAPAERIAGIVAVRMPEFFQVSLEGLREHNDHIRGAGHFDRILRFLDVLREQKVYSMVMLTLTRENMDQVIPLAGVLRGRADAFFFNRIALFGEGANLVMADRSRYRQFLEEYLAAAETNPVMGIKDSLINILRHERGSGLFGGCAGYGCGAAFNFVSLLADGEVHACRKLPSPLGNIRGRSFSQIYDSDLAKRYRRGPSSCTGCPVRVACGGCLAVTKSSGLDIFTQRDPFCFLPESREPEDSLSQGSRV